MFRLTLPSVLFILILPVAAAPPVRMAPNPSAKPVDQLVASGNACGPAALLNAFRFGSPPWQRVSSSIHGANDRELIYTIIRERGMRPSRHMNGHPRWSRSGVNLVDLCDIGNELARGQFLPPVRNEDLFLKSGESQLAHLRRVHRRLEGSMAKGMPPVVSLRRYVLRRQMNGVPQWEVLQAHFITLGSIPISLPGGARSFPVTYIDPWGGKIHQGRVAIANHAVLADHASKAPCLEADFPNALVGKNFLGARETTCLTVAAVLGCW
jgi:hypothetical protein